MDFRHLRYFVAAAETLSFNQASHRVHIAQPALSRQIQGLEADLGFALFQRLSRGVRLTPAGELFLVTARRLVVEAESARAQAKRIAQGNLGLLRVGYNDVALVNRVVAEAITRFRSERSDVELLLQSLISPMQIELLCEGGLDVGLLYATPKQHPDLNFCKIADYSYIIGLPPDHRLSGRATVKLADLADERFIWHTRQHAFLHEPLTAACKAGGLEPHIVQEVWSPSAQISLISTGLGVGFVHSLLSEQRVHTIHLKPVEDLDLPLPLYLTWSRSAESPAVDRFVAVLQGMLSKAGAAVLIHR